MRHVPAMGTGPVARPSPGLKRLAPVAGSASDMLKWAPLRKSSEKGLGMKVATAPRDWATFLANHASEIWACVFVQTYDLFFRPIFLFFIAEHGSRRVVHAGVTHHPTDEWVAQQVRNATPFGEGPRFLIRDNDRKYGSAFARVAKGTGIEVLRTPYRAPTANAICERFLGSLRRECLDHIIILGEGHLRGTLKEYVRYFNHARPHQGIGILGDAGKRSRRQGEACRSGG